MKPLFRTEPTRAPLAPLWLLLFVAALLLWPALWNGYPLFFYDSGDYIDASFTHTPKVWRTLPYGLFLGATHFNFSLWLPIIVQALLVAWLLFEFIATFAPRQPRLLTALVAPVVAIGTGLPWFTSQLMPDLFTAPMVMGLLLLAYGQLGKLRLAALAVVTVIAISAHASHAGTALALALLIAVAAIWSPRQRPRVGLPLVIVIAGILATPVSHRIFTGEFYLSRSAPIMALARLIRDGEAQIYLRQACPEAGYSLCPYVDQLVAGPNGANDFLWDQRSPFYRVEGWKYWQSFGAEARTIVWQTLSARPVENLEWAVRDWGEQLITFGTGAGLVPKLWEATEVQRQYFPAESERYLTARQYAGQLDLSGLNRLHVAVLGAAMVLGVVLALRDLRTADRVAQMLWLLIAATLVNAAITAIFSNPDDRYQARLVWLFVPAVVVAFTPRRPVGDL